MESERQQVSIAITALIEVIEDRPDLSGICALLCAVGAACHNEAAEMAMLQAVTPVMFELRQAIVGRNN